jgi:hypothetical protein
MPSQGVVVADEAAIGREIRNLREDTRNGFAKIESGLEKLLPREVYSANHEALKRRVDMLERELERVESARERDVERATEQRKSDAEKVEAARIATRRWLITAIVVPAVSVAVSIFLALTT